jgi:hypothetical protein
MDKKKLLYAAGLVFLGALALVWGVWRSLPRGGNADVLTSKEVADQVEQRELNTLLEMTQAQFDGLYNHTVENLASMKRTKAAPEDIAMLQKELDRLDRVKAERAKKSK